MEKGSIVKFDPKLLGALKETMGRLPAIPGDLAGVKSLTIFDKHDFGGKPGWIFLNWIQFAPGHFSVLGAMENLHTLLFKNKCILHVEDFSFLSRLKRLKKLDLSGTDFSDCTLLKDLVSLQHVVLPDRRRLVHTEILGQLSAGVETKPEKEERGWCLGLYGSGGRKETKRSGDTDASAPTAAYTADRRLIGWIAASLGGLPKTPARLREIRLLDSLGAEAFSDRKRFSDAVLGELPPWITEKEGDFSMIAKLPNLRALFLWGAGLSDFSFLADCGQLSYLNLWNTGFSDCGILAGLPALRCVCLPEQGKLKDLEILAARREAEITRKKEGVWDVIFSGGGKELPDTAPLLIKIEPELLKVENKTNLREQPYGAEEGETTEEEQGGRNGRTESEREREILTMLSHMNTGKPKPQEPKEETSFFRDDEFDDLAVVSGEEVKLSYKGHCRVRHVVAEFFMEAELSPVWDAFCALEEEEDNWKRLSARRAKEMTDELCRLIMEENVAVLFLSFDPWGEGPYLTLEFAGGWAAVNYMDDENAVYYSIYNPAYTKGSELCPVQVGGQSPVPKMLAAEDVGQTAKIVRYFLENGQLLPGTLWKTNQRN